MPACIACKYIYLRPRASAIQGQLLQLIFIPGNLADIKRICTGKDFTSVLLGAEVRKTALPGMVRQHRNGTADRRPYFKDIGIRFPKWECGKNTKDALVTHVEECDKIMGS